MKNNKIWIKLRKGANFVAANLPLLRQKILTTGRQQLQKLEGHNDDIHDEDIEN